MAPKPPPPPKKVGNEVGIFAQVDAAMNQIIIADLNRKLARLRALAVEFEQRNEELQNSYNKLDEDRADIIAYLKRSINTKNEENNELKDRIQGLEDLRDVDTKEFKRRCKELDTNFITVKAQLTSENKYLGGKINTLEEFRALRDVLTRKYDSQEKAIAEQEMKYKRIIYDSEKRVVVGKDKLKKEMEAKLLNLAQEFQDASESRIATSTHRVIRENIALNNELDNLLFTQAKVTEQNEKLKESQTAARIAMEAAEAERDKAINRSVVQLKVIEQLNTAYQNVQKNQALNQSKLQDQDHLKAKVAKLSKHNENMTLQLRILEQNLHAATGEQNKYIVQSARLTRERDKYKKVIREVTSAIQAALKKDQWALLDRNRKLLDRKVIWKNILGVINRHRFAIQSESVESLVSFGAIYEKGDLGFIPKQVPKLAKPPGMSVYSALPAESHYTSKSSSTVIPSSEYSVISLKTIPSIPVLPPVIQASITSSIQSIPSFTVTSLHSTPASSEHVSVDSFEALTDLEKKLALSKLEIQQSILKDLAMSQTGSRLLDTRTSDMKSRLSTSEMGEGEEDGGNEGSADALLADEASEDKTDEALKEDAAAGETVKEDAPAGEQDEEDKE